MRALSLACGIIVLAFAVAFAAGESTGVAAEPLHVSTPSNGQSLPMSGDPCALTRLSGCHLVLGGASLSTPALSRPAPRPIRWNPVDARVKCEGFRNIPFLPPEGRA